MLGSQGMADGTNGEAEGNTVSSASRQDTAHKNCGGDVFVTAEKVADDTGAPGTSCGDTIPLCTVDSAVPKNHGGIKSRRTTVYGGGIVADTSKADKQLGNANNGRRGGERPPLY